MLIEGKFAYTMAPGQFSDNRRDDRDRFRTTRSQQGRATSVPDCVQYDGLNMTSGIKNIA
jgi:hypothetical protein